MSIFSRSFWRSVSPLLCVLSSVCAAQQGKPQFTNVPQVEQTGGRVASFLTGNFQQPPNLTDILYIGAQVVDPGGGASTVTVGELLNHQGFTNLAENQIIFTSVSKVVAALGDFDNDGHTDYAFALSALGVTGTNICIYYGTGAQPPSSSNPLGGGSSYNGGTVPNAYPPTGGKSGCLRFVPQGSLPPNLAYIAAVPFTVGFPPGLVVEDSANNFIYVFANGGGGGNGGVLSNFTLVHQYAIPLADGAGPIYVGDFNGDNITDFIINGQAGASASVYFGIANGAFQPPVRYTFGHNVHSMLMQDMDGDRIPDMVVEGDKGVIEIHKGNANGTFATASEGGTAANVDGFSGSGGHLAVINPATLDILTTTPIGLSVLQNHGGLNYVLKNIYNIGSGRTSFALANFFGTGNLDLAVDSAEGVAIVLADTNGDGGFQTSNAYAALQPALGTAVAQFRTVGNPNHILDVAVATGTTQAQLLTGNGDGTFNTLPSPTNTLPSPNPTLWSNIVSGDFNGDGKPDIAYSLTGLPLPSPGSGSGLYIQFGIGDGTFQAPVAVTSSPGVPSNNNFYGASAVGDFNGDGIADIANIDASFDDMLLGKISAPPLNLGFNQQDPNNTSFNQVAAGFFKANRTSKQDLVFQEGANLIPYLNSGDGIHFTAKPALANPPSASLLVASAVMIADLDGDKNGDVIAVYFNPASNPFSARPVAPNQMYIWYGNGDGTFGAPQIVNLSRDYYLGAVADMNGDGKPDILLSDGLLVGILYNQGSRTFRSDFGTACNPCGEQHFLAGQGINSISAADVNGDGMPDLIVANGGVTISNPIVLGGKSLPSIALTPNPDVNTGGITVLANNITTKPVTGTLLATPEPSTYQATFTLTATLTPTAGVALPTGTVQFYIDGSLAGTGTAAPTPGPSTTSSATYTIPAGNTYLGGTHTLGAIYSGDTLNSPVSLTGSHLIQGGTTTTALYLCVGPTPSCPSNGFVFPPFVPALPMVYGQTFNGTAQVTSSDGGPLNGSTQFFDLYNGVSTLLCTLPTATGGTCPPSVGTGAQLGVHVFTAAYTGDSTHTGSTSPTVTITVVQDSNTATSLVGTPNPSPFGQPVTFTAMFTGNAAPPVGLVTFLNGSTVIGTATLVPNSTGFTSTAIFTTSTLPVGTDPITASYAATLDFAAATSAVFNETITPLLTGSFTLTVTPNPVTNGVGYATALTVTVTAKNGFVQTVNLACGNLPYEAACSFVAPSIAGGSGSTTLFVTSTAPHSCGTTQPYFLASNDGGPGMTPLALPALAGLAVMFIPGKRRWLRALVATIVVAGATQITGCGNCTDLGTRPNTYTFTVTATTTGNVSETQSQTITMTITI